jgi:hypothetical protein
MFSNPDLVTNIGTTKKTLALATNAGTKKSNQEAIVPGFGKVYYDKDAIANIFGFSDLKKKHRITYDSEKEDAFIVHMDDHVLKFECTPEGLYQYEVSQDKKVGTSNLISTVVGRQGIKRKLKLVDSE